MSGDSIDLWVKDVFDRDPRIERLMKAKFIRYEAAKRFWKEMWDLMAQDPRTAKINGSLLVAPAHSGKTTVVKEFRLAYAANVPGASVKDILYFAMQSRITTMKQTLTVIGHKLKIPQFMPMVAQGKLTSYGLRKISDTHTKDLLLPVAAKIRDTKKLVIVDELEKLYQVSSESRVEIFDTFHSLLNESHVPIILVGIEGVEDLLSSVTTDNNWLQETFSTRFLEFRLPRWTNGEEFIQILMALHIDCELKAPEGCEPFYKDSEIRKHILQLSDGLLGKIVLLVKRAARRIIREGLPEDITYSLVTEIAEECRSVKWKFEKDEETGEGGDEEQ
ncbi:MAG: TniB family NTP-binding protein [Candidatus Heimdallarchaeota archaeon]